MENVSNCGQPTPFQETTQLLLPPFEAVNPNPRLEKPADSWQIPHTNKINKPRQRIAGQPKTRHLTMFHFFFCLFTPLSSNNKYPSNMRDWRSSSLDNVSQNDHIFEPFSTFLLKLSTFSPTSIADRLDGFKRNSKSNSIYIKHPQLLVSPCKPFSHLLLFYLIC